MFAALLLATITFDTTAVRLTVQPQPAYIEQAAHAQLVNFDLIIENSVDEPLDLDVVRVTVHDKSGKLVLRKFIDGNGSRPSLRTLDLSEVPAKGKVLFFNPFDRFDPDVDLGSMTFDLELSSKNGERHYASQVTVTPKPYLNKAQLLLPVKGRMIVWDGHDFYAHHRRWDYTLLFLTQLGFHTNFMRYSYDFVPVNENGAMSEGDEKRNESWFGFGRDVRAVADGTVAALVDDQPDDRAFNPASIEEHGTMRIWGNYVVIDHGNGEFGLYGHIRQGSGKVKVGQRVKRGDAVAAIGASGSSLFPHLHFELQTGPGTDAEGLPSTFHDFVRIRGAQKLKVRSGIVESGEIVESSR
jgi:hypothetical protein